MDESENEKSIPGLTLESNAFAIGRGRAWYVVVLMSLCYGIGELSHFLVGTTSRAMSQDLGYGDQSCLRNESLQIDLGAFNVTCSDFATKEECNSAVLNDNSPCEWNYNGLGMEYQILAGPSFILALCIGGILIGALADRYNRIYILGVCTILFSACTVVMGTAQAVWQLIVLRFGVAFGESACQPVSASLVMSLLPAYLHGAALGLVNWGIYLGYALSYVVGNYIPPLDINGKGWRWAYYLSGIPGFIFAGLLIISKAEPRVHSQRDGARPLGSFEIEEQHSAKSLFVEAWKNLRFFFQPMPLILCLGACIRHTGGYTWAYNSQLYFDTYYPDVDVGLWLFLVSLTGGSFGILIGGTVSDRVVKRSGLHARAWVLGASQLIASPFAFGVLLLPPPYCFFSLLLAYLFAETWFGILFAILIELVPTNVCGFFVAVFLFVMNNVGGNLPIIVAPLSKLMGFRESLLLLYPGFYLLSAIVFGLTGFALRKRASQARDESQEATEGNSTIACE